ncbi:fasciclin domain-containing protein [Vibrio superstes]|uniref:Beta-Ig-H3/fasciclin domain-containing protein n=1 Tax=Vibrio superstes NBRC 103154 TaxID=1219062 RepID=A0A511QS57_9VIBR|nr:fasciclin domain-containing protein [Vibrio superstes]GEM80195.1 beta-Ig-H3/fasciclin domain-containing protein [Vibrio superstes NBRC 103154]
MKLLKATLLATLTLFFVTACDDDDDDTSSTLSAATIADAAVADGNFTTLVAAAQQADLVDTLSDPNAELTVFAPTDAAFEKFLMENNLTADELLGSPDLADILTYHVIAGEVDAATAIGLAGTTVEKVNGDNSALSLSGENLLVNTATVTATDILTGNGIIHVIDAVLVPPADVGEPTSNIVETAINDGRFTVLVQALITANLDGALADENETYTVFAPTDDAFTALLAELNIDAATLLANPDLATILLNHVVQDAAVDSVTAMSLNGTSATTMAMKEIAIAIDEETDTLTVGGSTVIIRDVYTTNGVIHVIDAVIID